MIQAHGISPSVVAALLSVAGLLVGVPCAWGQAVTSVPLGELLARRCIANAGQWPPEVHFAAGTGANRVWVGEDSLSFLIQDVETGRAATLRFEVTSRARLSAPRGLDRLPGEHHFLRGADPNGWARHVPAYRSVLLESPRDGIALQIVPRARGAQLVLEWQPWAVHPEITLQVEGSNLVVEAGRLAFETPLGRLGQCCGACGSGSSEDCPSCGGGLRFAGDSLLRWVAPQQDLGRAIVGLEWSTFLGGTKRDVVNGVAFASDGTVVVAGHTRSMDFPTTPGSFDPTHAPPHPQFGDNDLFVARMTADGAELAYATFLGGVENDFCYGMVLSEANEVVALAYTFSPDYPTTPRALSSNYAFGGDAGVTRFASDGSALVFSTFLGGSSLEVPNALTLAPDGGIIVVGETESPDFPVTPGAFDPVLDGRDGFVSKLAPDGKSLVFSTFLGALGTNRIEAVALFPDGSLALGGEPGSAEFPTTPAALQATQGGSFLTRMSSDGSSLLWSTFFGGTSPNDIKDVAVDRTGVVTLVGTVSFVTPPSAVFPITHGSFDPTYNGSSDAFVARVNASGTALLSSTFLGGGAQDEAWDLVLDPGGVATVFGHTRSPDFPATPGAYDTSKSVDWDLFVARLSPESDRVFYATFLGGSLAEPDQGGREMDGALSPDGEAVIVSTTLSVDYPATPGAFDTTGQVGDGVVTKLTMLPAGVEALGSATPGCAGSLPIGVTAMPQIGSSSFGLWSSGVEPFARFGLLGLGRRPLESPLLVEGIDLWLDPGLLVALPVASDALGYAEVRLPIPDLPLLAGKRFWAQFFWSDSCGAAGWASSRALQITFQP